ncbi:MAG: TonB-dependent receptor [Candidatus Sphingomonas phytovorans]|nr:TonB-dependent receptor [Sphingomonas sp.]WEK02234.1 MAG: TonB-dependent receptor [Sphingomonas sp.]
MKIQNYRARRALLVSASCTVLLVATAAHAQDRNESAPRIAAVDTAPPPTAPADTAAPQDDIGKDIVVTGSRTARSGADAPTPVTVLGADSLQKMGIRNIGEGLQLLPQFVPTAGPAYVDAGAPPGQRLANLRGMGANRTLVLFDGRRFTPTTSLGTVDLNLLPSMLTSRAEVVTGGASAAYGADAVAGVINVIPDRTYTGLKAEVQTGITEAGDARKFRAAAAGGISFADGKGHLIGSFEYEDNAAADDCYSRSWCQQEWGTVAIPPASRGSNPARIITSNVHNASVAPGGLITTTALRGTQFLGGQSTSNYVFGSPASSTAMVGGSGHDEYFLYKDTQLEMPVRRMLAYASGNYKFSDAVELYFSGNWGKLDSQARARQVDFGSLTINAANPFLPTAVRNQAAALGITSFQMGRLNEDINPQQFNHTQMYQFAGGLRGSLGGSWKWDAFYQYGYTKLTLVTANNRITANFNKALDARTNSAGQIVCGVNADAITSNDDPACVPLNLFGSNQYSQAAFNYAYGTGTVTTTVTENVAGLNLSGSPFKTWAGPVTVAFGGEYRKDIIKGDADPLSLAFAFAQGNGQRYRGLVDVKEGYLEATVPLAKDMTLLHNLELNGAVRLTSYNISGTTWTWKGGLVYEPFQGLRLRATRSRDIRAPNATELFSGRTQAPGQFTDFIGPGNPLGSGTQAPILVTSSSNPNLSPEKADTWTLGAVVSPSNIVPGLTISVDYYNIHLTNAIGRLGALNIIQRCAAGATEFCALMTRDPTTHVLTGVLDTYLNFGGIKARGLDVQLDYSLPLNKVSNSLGGRLTASLFASKAFELTTIDSAGSVNRAGMLGQVIGLLTGPDLVMDGTIGYEDSRFRVSLETRYIKGGTYDATNIDPTDPGYSPSLSNSINNNHVDGRVYQNLAFGFKVPMSDKKGFEFYGAVTNLWNRDPPVAPSAYSSTSPSYFDVLGRAFKIGARVEF